MINYKIIPFLAGVLILTACKKDMVAEPKATEPYKNWQLNISESQFSFVTIKNKTVNEEHTIQYTDGQIDAQGEVNIKLDLTTVNTLIELRDQRMKELLFEVDEYPLATITSKLDQELPLNTETSIDFDLNLHGISQSNQANVMIQQVDDRLIVTNFEPIIINGKDYNLDQGINQLTKIAGLQSINYEVLVDFKLVFEK